MLASCATGSTIVYVDKDFTAPNTGGYQVVFGEPTVQPSVGPLQDALVFKAVSSYEQIKFSGPRSSSGLEIHYDLLTHNLRDSNYGFTILFDTPQVRTMTFHGGLDQLTVFIPGSFSGFGPSFNDDQVYHIGMWIDFRSQTWDITLDGVPFQTLDFDAYAIDSIRFSLAPAYGGTLDAPNTYVALDNLTIASIPEPPAWSLILAAVIPACFWYRRNKLIPKLVAP